MRTALVLAAKLVCCQTRARPNTGWCRNGANSNPQPAIAAARNRNAPA
jgi:hypothetical protein